MSRFTRTSIAHIVALAVATGSLIAAPLVASPAAAATGSVWDARQIDGVPNSFYWAVIVGVTDYAGSTGDSFGSAQDAWALRDYLLSLGWRPDHIYMVTSLSASRYQILRAIGWLASKSNSRSLAVFHYSGHEKPFRTWADGDGETQDVAIWASDNRYILDGELGRELGRVNAYRMWIHISACRAAGFSDPGMSKPNRVITWASAPFELAFVTPALGHTWFGYFTIVDGMRNKRADANRDGKVSVEEAFWYSRGPVMSYTQGRQHPWMSDRWSGEFTLAPPR
ncbi:MAG TPA: caspase family protein [Actinomycetota bacterium]